MAAYLSLVLSESNVNVANNTSVVTANLYYYGNGASWNANSPSGTITIAGTSYGFSHSFTKSTSAQWLGSASKTITHNPDGSGSVYASASFATGVSLGTLTTSASLTLTTIPRATTPTVSPASVVLGNAVTIDMPRASSGFTHTLEYSIGNTSGTIGTSLGTSKSWTPSIDLASELPSAVSGTVAITCKTYNGSTHIGTKTVNLTVEVPESVVPSISSVALSEAVNSVTTNFGTRYVQNLSQLNVAVNSSGARGSTIKSYSVTIDDVTYNQQSFTSNVLRNAGTISVSARVTDSRGREATHSQTITVVAYESPSITSVTYQYCDSDGTLNPSGTCTKITITGKVASVDSQNSRELKLKYKLASATTYTTVTVTTSSWEFTATRVITNTAQDVTYEYIAELTDKISTDSYGVSTGKVVISRRAGGDGVTFFGEATEDGFVVKGGKTSKFTGDIQITTDSDFESLWTSLFG